VQFIFLYLPYLIVVIIKVNLIEFNMSKGQFLLSKLISYPLYFYKHKHSVVRF